MSPISLIAVGIVIAAIILMLALVVSMIAEKPSAQAVTIEVLCPVTEQVTHVGVTTASTGWLAVVSCERFPNGVLECDRACVPARLAA